MKVKVILFFSGVLFLILYPNILVAQIKVVQDNRVGIGTSTPDPSAKLHVESDKGVLISRMSLSTRDNIADPANGLIVFVSDTNPNIRGYYYYDSGVADWVRLLSELNGTAINVVDGPNIDLSISEDDISAELTETGVVAGNYSNANIVVDEFGRIVSAANGGGQNGQMNSIYNRGANNVNLTTVDQLIGSVTITPTSSQSKIFITARAEFQKTTSGTKIFTYELRRNNTTLITNPSITYESATSFMPGPCVFTVIDAPNVATPVTYDLYARISVSGGTSRNWEIAAIELSSNPGPAGPQGPVGPQGADGIGGKTVAGQGITIVGQGSIASPYVISSNFTEIDGSITNEIQNLSTNGASGNIALSSGGEININVNDGDYSPTNELQTLSIDGTHLAISNGNTVTLPSAVSTPTHLSTSGLSGTIGINSSTGNDIVLVEGDNVSLFESNDSVYIDANLNESDPLAWRMGGNTLINSGNNQIGSLSGTTDHIQFIVNGSNKLKIDNFGRLIPEMGSLESISIGGNTGASYGASPATCVGFYAGDMLTSGQYNSFFGYYAGNSTTSGSFNSFFGDFSGAYNTTGIYNTFIGTGAGASNTTGEKNTYIGYSAGGTIASLNNTTSIGLFSSVNASNKIRLGNSNITAIEGQVSFSTPSDLRFKYNIKNFEGGLDFINKLNPVSYNFDTKKFQEHLIQNYPDSLKRIYLDNDFYESSAIVHSGFLAQEVDTICKELGLDFDGLIRPDPNNATSHYSIAYSQFVVPLVRAVQEQQVIIENGNDAIKSLNAKLEDQEKLILSLIARIEKLEKE